VGPHGLIALAIGRSWKRRRDAGVSFSGEASGRLQGRTVRRLLRRPVRPGIRRYRLVP